MSAPSAKQGIWEFISGEETHYAAHPGSRSQIHFPLLSGSLPSNHQMQAFWNASQHQPRVYNEILDAGLLPGEGVTICTRKLQNGQRAPCFSVDVRGAANALGTAAEKLYKHIKDSGKVSTEFIVEVCDSHKMNDYTVYPQADSTNSTNRDLIDRRQNFVKEFVERARSIYPQYIDTNGTNPNIQACLMRKPHTGPASASTGSSRRLFPAQLLEGRFVEHTICIQFYGDAEGDFVELRKKLEAALEELKQQPRYSGVEMQVRIAEWL